MTLTEARDFHATAHAAYVEHGALGCCVDGRLCIVGWDLREEADEAGDRWARLQDRVTAAATR